MPKLLIQRITFEHAPMLASNALTTKMKCSVLAAWSIAFSLSIPALSHPLSANPPMDELAALANRQRVEFVTTNPKFPIKTLHGLIEGKAADSKDMESYLPIFLAEWQLYPPELIRKTGLKRVILCGDLSFAGQRRGAIPDFEHNDLYFDVKRGRHNELYIRKVIHHEFYHIIDLRDDGLLYADERWAALNPPGFKYGAGGKNAQGDATVSLITDAVPGFLNKYSMTGVEEDKAEIFANLVVNGPAIEKRANVDKVIASKVTRLKETLTAFCPQVDARFWEGARKVVRGDAPRAER